MTFHLLVERTREAEKVIVEFEFPLHGDGLHDGGNPRAAVNHGLRLLRGYPSLKMRGRPRWEDWSDTWYIMIRGSYEDGLRFHRKELGTDENGFMNTWLTQKSYKEVNGLEGM